VLTGAFSLPEAGIQFVIVGAGGIAVGMFLSLMFVLVHRYLGDAFIEVLTSLSVPYAAYILAESMQVSGVLAVVAAGLVRGRYSPEIVSAEMRILARSVWNLLVFLLNSLVFILIGTRLSAIVDRLGGYSAWELGLYGILVSTVAIAVRFAWVYPVTHLPHMLGAYLRKQAPAPPKAEFIIMSWCGMRGIVSLAAALALPVTTQNEAPFPYRDLIVFLTFVVIAVTLVLQGLTLKPLIRRLKVGTDWSVQEEQQRARYAMVNAAILAIDDVARRESIPGELAERIRADFAEKLTLALPAADIVASPHAAMIKRLRQAAVRAERHELIRIWRENQISDDVLHELEEMLDYEESHL
jgi:Na+/H+ antiporter